MRVLYSLLVLLFLPGSHEISDDCCGSNSLDLGDTAEIWVDSRSSLQRSCKITAWTSVVVEVTGEVSGLTVDDKIIVCDAVKCRNISAGPVLFASVGSLWTIDVSLRGIRPNFSQLNLTIVTQERSLHINFTALIYQPQLASITELGGLAVVALDELAFNEVPRFGRSANGLAGSDNVVLAVRERTATREAAANYWLFHTTNDNGFLESVLRLDSLWPNDTLQDVPKRKLNVEFSLDAFAQFAVVKIREPATIFAADLIVTYDQADCDLVRVSETSRRVVTLLTTHCPVWAPDFDTASQMLIFEFESKDTEENCHVQFHGRRSRCLSLEPDVDDCQYVTTPCSNDAVVPAFFTTDSAVAIVVLAPSDAPVPRSDLSITARVAPRFRRLMPGEEGRWTQLGGVDISNGRQQVLLLNSTFHYEVEYVTNLVDAFRIESNQGYWKEVRTADVRDTLEPIFGEFLVWLSFLPAQMNPNFLTNTNFSVRFWAENVILPSQENDRYFDVPSLTAVELFITADLEAGDALRDIQLRIRAGYAFPSLMHGYLIASLHWLTALDLRTVNETHGYSSDAVSIFYAQPSIGLVLIFHTDNATCDDVSNLFLFNEIGGDPTAAIQSLSELCPADLTSVPIFNQVRISGRFSIVRTRGPPTLSHVSLLIYGESSLFLHPLFVVDREKSSLSISEKAVLVTKNRGSAWIAVFIQEGRNLTLYNPFGGGVTQHAFIVPPLVLTSSASTLISLASSRKTLALSLMWTFNFWVGPLLLRFNISLLLDDATSFGEAGLWTELSGLFLHGSGANVVGLTMKQRVTRFVYKVISLIKPCDGLQIKSSHGYARMLSCLDVDFEDVLESGVNGTVFDVWMERTDADASARFIIRFTATLAGGVSTATAQETETTTIQEDVTSSEPVTTRTQATKSLNTGPTITQFKRTTVKSSATFACVGGPMLLTILCQFMISANIFS